MESEQQSIRILIRSKSGKEQSGLIQIVFFSRAKRIFSALLTFLASALATTMMIAVPVMHFLLVPLGIMLSLFLAIRAYSRRSLIKDGAATCPECGCEFKIFKRPYDMPFNDICEGCRRELTISAH